MRAHKNETPRHSALGRQLFGYSRGKTQALLAHTAMTIEQLEASDAARRRELEAANDALEAVKAENQRARKIFVAMKAEIERLKTEAESRPDIDPAVGEALISAHRTAGEIVAKAHETAHAIELAARQAVSDTEARARSLLEHASSVRDQVERDRALWAEFLRRALETADQLRTEPQPRVFTEVLASDPTLA